MRTEIDLCLAAMDSHNRTLHPSSALDHFRIARFEELIGVTHSISFLYRLHAAIQIVPRVNSVHNWDSILLPFLYGANAGNDIGSDL
jgi:hypothetical protein